MAGIIAGSGGISEGVYAGIAPASHLISLKVLDKWGNGNTKSVIEGIRWLVQHQDTYCIRIVNISVGMVLNAGSKEQSQMLEAVDYAWDNGMVVVAAAGNNGPGEGSVTIPGISRKIITVGCFDDHAQALRGQGLKDSYSGRGPTQACVVKPEVVGPGTNIVSCGMTGGNWRTNLSGGSRWDGYGYVKKSGTSMAAPVVSGAIALLLNKYPFFTPRDVKLRLYERAVDLKLPLQKQGWGMVDIERLL